jgi:hypothetical protein
VVPLKIGKQIETIDAATQRYLQVMYLGIMKENIGHLPWGLPSDHMIKAGMRIVDKGTGMIGSNFIMDKLKETVRTANILSIPTFNPTQQVNGKIAKYHSHTLDLIIAKTAKALGLQDLEPLPVLEVPELNAMPLVDLVQPWLEAY